MTVLANDNRFDWTKSDAHATCQPVRWREWMERAIEAIRMMDQGTPFPGEHASEALLRMGDYLDAQFDGGYDGITLVPRENFVMTLDR